MDRNDLENLKYGDVIRYSEGRYRYLIVEKVEDGNIRGMGITLVGKHSIALDSQIGKNEISLDELAKKNPRLGRFD